MRKIDKRHKLYEHLIFLILSICIAVWIIKTGEIDKFLTSLREFRFLGSFGAGMLFTSVFTTAPSMAILGEISQARPLLEVVLLGGLGALFGDYLIFKFVRDDLSQDFKFILSHSKLNRLKALSKSKIFKWLIPFMGALVIASPLPDELGLAMMGFAKLRMRYFVPISFIFNSLGILIIGLVARNIAQ